MTMCASSSRLRSPQRMSWVRRASSDPPQDHLHPSDELVDAKGFGEIVVPADRQAVKTVGRGIPAR